MPHAEILARDPDSFSVPPPQVSDSTGAEKIQAFTLAFAPEVALMSLPEDLAAPVVDVFAAYGCDLTQVTSDPSWIHGGPLVTNRALLSIRARRATMRRIPASQPCLPVQLLRQPRRQRGRRRDLLYVSLTSCAAGRLQTHERLDRSTFQAPQVPRARAIDPHVAT